MMANLFDSNFGCVIESHFILYLGSILKWHSQGSDKSCSRPNCSLKCSLSSIYIRQKPWTAHELFNFTEFCFRFGFLDLISMTDSLAQQSCTTGDQIAIKDLPCHPPASSFDRRFEQPDVQLAEARTHAPCTFLFSVYEAAALKSLPLILKASGLKERSDDDLLRCLSTNEETVKSKYYYFWPCINLSIILSVSICKQHI